MESNQDQALMRGPPDHRANGPDIPLSGYVVSFSALLTCLSPRNSVRTCALARVEGSVPPTSGFGIRRSPLSYTRILFERVRICTSQRGSIGRVYLTTRPPGLPPSVSPYQSASTLFRHRSMVCNPLCGITSQLLYESSSAVLLQSGLVLRQPEPHLHPSASQG